MPEFVGHDRLQVECTRSEFAAELVLRVQDDIRVDDFPGADVEVHHRDRYRTTDRATRRGAIRKPDHVYSVVPPRGGGGGLDGREAGARRRHRTPSVE